MPLYLFCSWQSFSFLATSAPFTVNAWIFGMVWGAIIWVDLMKRLKCKKWLKVGLLYKRFILVEASFQTPTTSPKFKNCAKTLEKHVLHSKTTSPLTPHSHSTSPSSHRSYGHHLHVEVSKHTAQVEHKLSWWFLHRPGDRGNVLLGGSQKASLGVENKGYK